MHHCQCHGGAVWLEGNEWDTAAGSAQKALHWEGEIWVLAAFPKHVNTRLVHFLLKHL